MHPLWKLHSEVNTKKLIQQSETTDLLQLEQEFISSEVPISFKGSVRKEMEFYLNLLK